MWVLGWAVGIGVVVLAHTAPFPFLLEYISPHRSLWHMPRRGGPPTIYLTYDDGPNPTATPALLDVLAHEGVPATFFIIPKFLTEETAPIVKRMFDEGHGVALHSHTRLLMFRGSQSLANLLASQAAETERLAGSRPCPLFRPQAGWRGGEMYAGLERAGYRLAGWSFGMWDWNWYRPSNPAKMANRLVRRASDGDIIVMHDGSEKNPRADRQQTVAATAQLVPLLKSRGFRFGQLCAAASRIDGHSAMVDHHHP